MTYVSSIPGASVTCDSTCQEDASLGLLNLTSSEPARRQRGFLVDYFIKPPIKVVFHWPYAIRVRSLRLLAR